MKKIILVFAIILTATALSQAQYFGGGSLGFNASGGKVDFGDVETDMDSQSSFHFNPRGGIMHSDNLWLGLELNLSVSRDKEAGDPEIINTSTAFGFAPFVRYYALEMGKFSLFGQGQLGLDFISSKSESGGTTTSSPNTTRIRLSAFPGVSYQVSEMLALEATINAFNFSAYRSVQKSDNGDKAISNGIGFGAGLDNLATTGALTIGATVKF
jgi:hypothetical protein